MNEFRDRLIWNWRNLQTALVNARRLLVGRAARGNDAAMFSIGEIDDVLAQAKEISELQQQKEGCRTGDLKNTPEANCLGSSNGQTPNCS